MGKVISAGSPVMKRGGRKLKLCVCVWVCEWLVCLGLTASPPCVKSFRLWFGPQQVSFIDPRLLCTGTFPLSLSGSGSLSWVFLHLCCWSCSGWSLWLCFWVCPQSVFCLLSTCFLSLFGIWSVVLSLTVLVVPPFTSDQRCGLHWTLTSKRTRSPHDWFIKKIARCSYGHWNRWWQETLKDQ